RMIDVTSPSPQAAASDAVLARQLGRTVHRVLLLLASAVTVAMTVAACSSWSSLTGGAAPEPAATAPPALWDGSFTSRIKSLFSGDSGKLSSPASAEIDCPGVEYRQGAGTWVMNGAAGDALSVKYQVSFLQTARECIVADSNVTIKVGVQG